MSPVLQVRVRCALTLRQRLCPVPWLVVDLAIARDSRDLGHFFFLPPLIVKLMGGNQLLERGGHFQVVYSTRFQTEDDREKYSRFCVILLHFVPSFIYSKMYYDVSMMSKERGQCTAMNIKMKKTLALKECTV